MLKFLYYYIRSMRLYYGFVTATTVLMGLCLAHEKQFETFLPWTLKDAALWAMGFFAWGFNQIFSDWYDRKEDAINAPHRPMVTGVLAPRPAFALSAVGLATIAIAGFLMSPWTLVFLALGGALNIAYSLLKKVPVLNCFVYACAISCCALFAIAGYLKECPDIGAVLYVLMMILPVHFLMCHNSYYKDVAGDRVTGVRTLQTMYPDIVAKALSALLSALGVAASLLLACGMDDCVGEWWLFFLQPIAILTLAVMFFHALVGRRYHAATCLNCQLCVALLHMLWFDVTWRFELVSLVAIQLLFFWYDDEKE